MGTSGRNGGDLVRLVSTLLVAHAPPKTSGISLLPPGRRYIDTRPRRTIPDNRQTAPSIAMIFEPYYGRHWGCASEANHCISLTKLVTHYTPLPNIFGTDVCLTIFWLRHLQYRTPLIKNKKQKSWSRLDFIFENGCVLYTNFSKRHLPNFSCSRKSPPAFSCARFLPNRCPVLLLSTGWSIGFNFIVFNLRFFLKIRFVD